MLQVDSEGMSMTCPMSGNRFSASRNGTMEIYLKIAKKGLHLDQTGLYLLEANGTLTHLGVNAETAANLSKAVGEAVENMMNVRNLIPDFLRGDRPRGPPGRGPPGRGPFGLGPFGRGPFGSGDNSGSDSDFLRGDRPRGPPGRGPFGRGPFGSGDNSGSDSDLGVDSNSGSDLDLGLGAESRNLVNGRAGSRSENPVSAGLGFFGF